MALIVLQYLIIMEDQIVLDIMQLTTKVFSGIPPVTTASIEQLVTGQVTINN